MIFANKKKNPRPHKETEGKPFAVPLLLIRFLQSKIRFLPDNGGDRPPFGGMLRNEFGSPERRLAATGDSLMMQGFS